MKTRLNMLSEDEHEHTINSSSKYIDDFSLRDQLRKDNRKTKSTKRIDSFPLTFLHWLERILEWDWIDVSRSRTAASKKKNENDKWEAQFAEFDEYDGMPESSSSLNNWKRNQ